MAPGPGPAVQPQLGPSAELRGLLGGSTQGRSLLGPHFSDEEADAQGGQAVLQGTVGIGGPAAGLSCWVGPGLAFPAAPHLCVVSPAGWCQAGKSPHRCHTRLHLVSHSREPDARGVRLKLQACCPLVRGQWALICPDLIWVPALDSGAGSWRYRRPRWAGGGARVVPGGGAPASGPSPQHCFPSRLSLFVTVACLLCSIRGGRQRRRVRKEIRKKAGGGEGRGSTCSRVRRRSFSPW